jgi:hypothetical protein
MSSCLSKLAAGKPKDAAKEHDATQTFVTSARAGLRGTAYEALATKGWAASWANNWDVTLDNTLAAARVGCGVVSV